MRQLYDFQTETLAYMQNMTENIACIAIPTGGGKTFTFSNYAYQQSKLNKKTLIVVNRIELLQQTFDEIASNFLYFPQIINAQNTSNKSDTLKQDKLIYIAMLETLKKRPLLLKKLQSEIDTLIIDECHLADSFPLVLNYKWNKILGFTATPQHISKKYSLQDIYKNLHLACELKELLKLNILLPPLTYAPAKLINQDISSSLKTSKSDYDSEEMTNKLMESTIFADCIDSIKKFKQGRTLIYNASVTHSKAIHEQLLKEGFESYHIDGTTLPSDRKQIIQKFSQSQDAIINNCNVLTFGFNERFVQTVIINRLTKSENLFIQMVGRGARSAPEIQKENFILLDLYGNAIKLGLWEDERNWHLKFKNKKVSSGKLAPAKLCPKCETINPAQSKICSNCGHIFETSKDSEDKQVIKDDLILMRKQLIIDTKLKTIMSQTIEKGHKLYKGLYEIVNFIYKNKKQKPPEVIDQELIIGLKSWIQVMKTQNVNKRLDKFHIDFVKNHFQSLQEKDSRHFQFETDSNQVNQPLHTQ
jgi:DNA repair protein RadD